MVQKKGYGRSDKHWGDLYSSCFLLCEDQYNRSKSHYMARDMRLSIFARLIISYLVLFSMLAGVSLYFIYHLSRFNQITRSIILNDTSILEYSNQLSDALLSESRYDRKYVVLKDEALYESYLQAKNEFNQLLNEALDKNNLR